MLYSWDTVDKVPHGKQHEVFQMVGRLLGMGFQ